MHFAQILLVFLASAFVFASPIEESEQSDVVADLDQGYQEAEAVDLDARVRPKRLRKKKIVSDPDTMQKKEEPPNFTEKDVLDAGKKMGIKV